MKFESLKSLRLKGIGKFIHSVFMFLTYPFRHGFKFLGLLFVGIVILAAIPMSQGVSYKHIFDWYMLRYDQIETKINTEKRAKPEAIEREVKTKVRKEFKFKEKEANEFAAAFLMPETSFIKDVALDPQNLNYYLQLKRKWKVSIAAMLYRTCELKIITQNQYQYMIRIMQSKGWRKNEPLDNILVSPVPSLFIDAVDVLLTNNVFTPKEFVAELSELGLAMNPDELETLLNLKNNTLNDQASEPAKIVILKTIKGRYDYDTN